MSSEKTVYNMTEVKDIKKYQCVFNNFKKGLLMAKTVMKNIDKITYIVGGFLTVMTLFCNFILDKDISIIVVYYLMVLILLITDISRLIKLRKHKLEGMRGVIPNKRISTVLLILLIVWFPLTRYMNSDSVRMTITSILLLQIIAREIYNRVVYFDQNRIIVNGELFYFSNCKIVLSEEYKKNYEVVLVSGIKLDISSSHKILLDLLSKYW